MSVAMMQKFAVTWLSCLRIYLALPPRIAMPFRVRLAINSVRIRWGMVVSEMNY